MFIGSRSAHVASEQVNSPVSSMFVTESLWPLEENITIGGRSETALKKLYGARLRRPSALTVPIQPMGRGAASALNGLKRRPWSFFSVS